MTGPPYPHPSPAPGASAIGEFAIGISPVGDIPTFDVWNTILSQYANSPVITGIIVAFNAAMDQTADIDNFYDLIFNVLTAQGYGLDVWGRIVGVTRTVVAVAPVSAPTFGFQEPGGDWVGFGQAPFFSGTALVNNITLTDAQFRPVVLAKIATNVWDGSIPGFNKILLALFQGKGTPNVIDNGNMSITLNFPFVLSTLDQAIVQSSGCLPQPTGVLINLTSAPPVVPPVVSEGNAPSFLGRFTPTTFTKVFPSSSTGS